MPLSNKEGCKEFKMSDFKKDGNETGLISGNDREFFKDRVAIIVFRGACSFVQKSLNIQKIGGKIAVIIDNVDENENDIVIIDMFNQGDLIYIPTYMIS